MRILVTCFEPFGDHSENASAEVAARLAAGWEDAEVELCTRTMSVVFDVGIRQLNRSVAELRPDAILAIGEDDSQEVCTVELVGRNAADPDFAGQNAPTAVRIDSGPDERACTFNAQDLCDRMNAHGVRTELSDDAGLHMCNTFAYLLPTFSVPAGFLHVPAIRSTSADASVKLDALAAAVAAAVVSLKAQVAAIRVADR
ncbi:MAG: hypothetical protein WCC60_17265 [Ilumatobacteraceae bacterium]